MTTSEPNFMQPARPVCSLRRRLAKCLDERASRQASSTRLLMSSLFAAAPLGARGEGGADELESGRREGVIDRYVVSIAPSMATRSERACPCFWSALFSVFHSGYTGATVKSGTSYRVVLLRNRLSVG